MDADDEWRMVEGGATREACLPKGEAPCGKGDPPCRDRNGRGPPRAELELTRFVVFVSVL